MAAIGAPEVTDDNFKTEVLDSNIPVLVDFWGVGCPPCTRIAPIINELEQELAGKVKIVKLDVYMSPETTAEYGVSSVPTLILFRKGEEVARMNGAPLKPQLLAWINSH